MLVYVLFRMFCGENGKWTALLFHFSSAVKVPQSSLQIASHSNTFAYQLVAAAMQSAAGPIGSSGGPFGHCTSRAATRATERKSKHAHGIEIKVNIQKKQEEHFFACNLIFNKYF